MARTCSHDVLTNNDGEWWVDWLSNNVTVIGPKADIKAFKALCIKSSPRHSPEPEEVRFILNDIMPAPADLLDDDLRNWRNDNWGSDRDPWNVKIGEPSDPWTLYFSFESAGGFPEPVFRVLAERFPRLAFYCFSLEFGYNYMEFGWFNGPPGCEAFHEVEWDDMPEVDPVDDVARDAMSELRHHAAMAQLKLIAEEIDNAS